MDFSGPIPNNIQTKRSHAQTVHLGDMPCRGPERLRRSQAPIGSNFSAPASSAGKIPASDTFP
jgi:hypothetical protein